MGGGPAAAALRAMVSGEVQGVGFRAAVIERAQALGLFGWVRNDPEGTVRVHAEGAAEGLAALRAFLAEGPPGARVVELDEQPAKVEGHEQFAVRGVAAGSFTVRTPTEGGPAEFRLEVAGGWRAWRLPKGPPVALGERRLAVELDPAAPPVAGTMWDEGDYEQGGRVAWPEALERGHAMVVLHGERLQGGFALQRTRPAQWLLVKRRD